MERQFFPGAAVRCIDAGPNRRLTKGATYIVERVTSHGVPYLKIRNTGTFRASRFELVGVEEVKQPAPFGTIKSVTVSIDDLLVVMSDYLNDVLGVGGKVTSVTVTSESAVLKVAQA